MIIRIMSFLALFILLGRDPAAADPNKWRADAMAIPSIINTKYAYLDRLSAEKYTLSAKLAAEAEAVHDEDSLLSFAERALLLLHDHHAITGSSFKNSWAVVPSYSDLTVAHDGTDYIVTDVRIDSPAYAAAIKRGMKLTAINGILMQRGIADFWAELGIETVTPDQAVFAVNILAAGRRDQHRRLAFDDELGTRHDVVLSSLYGSKPELPPVTAHSAVGGFYVIINNSLGDDATIAAFDKVMQSVKKDEPIHIDLSNTPSGGNTTVARAIMGWFVSKPTGYQIHRSPEEERETSIPRQWIEQVLPRPGIMAHTGPVVVIVGAWTGSMGEGLAIGLKAIGARVIGRPMAKLLGSVEDIRLPNTGLVIKLPTEKLYSVDGILREDFIPEPLSVNIPGHK